MPATTAWLGAHVVACAFDRAGTQAAFALGDGTLRLCAADGAGDWTSVGAHDGAVLALAADSRRTGFVSGGDDGRFMRVGADGTLGEIAGFGRRWVEHVASFPDGAGTLVCASGKTAHVFSGAGERLHALAHPSTVTSLAFDAKGKRLAASHYNGASLWLIGARAPSPRLFEWKGSHIAVALHPAGEAVVTAMQENALHGWRLPDGHDMRMTGYPSKTESLSFTRNGRYLATSGADALVLWPFFGGGPMGKAPLELAQVENVLCTRCAAHPAQDMVAAGYADGRVLLASIGTPHAIALNPGGEGPVSAMAWSPDGRILAVGTEQGFAALLTLG